MNLDAIIEEAETLARDLRRHFKLPGDDWPLTLVTLSTAGVIMRTAIDEKWLSTDEAKEILYGTKLPEIIWATQVLPRGSLDPSRHH